MNTEQYILPSNDAFACNVYRKGYPQNQHMQELQLHNEGNMFSEQRHSQPITMNAEQLMPAESNPFTCSIYGVDFSQNHCLPEKCPDISQVRRYNDQGCSQIVKMSSENFNHAVANHLASDVYGKKFPQNPDFQQHGFSPREILNFSCDKCKKRFAKREELDLHHCIQSSFMCDICKKEFSEKSVLEKHQLLHTLEQPFACAVCGSRFSTLPDLTIHLRVHSEKKPAPKKLIEKRPISKEGLHSNPVVIIKEGRFACDMCEKSYTTKQSLNLHKVCAHSDERPYACDVCEMKFKTNRHLHRHYQNVHTEERPYACDQCEKKFKRKKSLTYHLLRHANVKPFQCDKCTMKFTIKDHLQKHQRVHTKEKEFSCPVCPVQYANRQSFYKHVRSHDEQNDSQKGKVNSEQIGSKTKKINSQRSVSQTGKVSTEQNKSRKVTILKHLNKKQTASSETTPSTPQEQVRWRLKIVGCNKKRKKN